MYQEEPNPVMHPLQEKEESKRSKMLLIKELDHRRY